MHPESVEKWIGYLNKLEGCTTLAPKYIKILAKEIERTIEGILKGVPAPVIVSEAQMKNALKYGWVIIENANMLKFLLYKGLKEGLRELQYQDSCEVIKELKLVCQKDTQTLGFRMSEFNELF